MKYNKNNPEGLSTKKVAPLCGATYDITDDIVGRR